MGSERKAEDIYRDKKSRDRKGNECQNRKKGTGLDLSSSLEGKQSLFATEMAATMLVSVASAANGIRKRNTLKKAQRSALKAASPKRSVRSNAASEEAPPPNPKSGFEYAQDLPGITAPLGFWDPASFCANTSPDEVKRFREAELTHGRVAMLAAIGYLVGELPAVENNPLFNGAVSGPALRQFQQVEAEGGFFWEILVLVIAITEGYRISYGWKNPKQGGGLLEDDYTPGDLGFDPLNLAPTDPEELKALKTKEINNGRLAMFAIAGFVAQEEIDGKKILEHLGVSL